MTNPPVTVGQKVARCPITFSDRENGANSPRKTMSGVVVYVHPQGRYHTVEFELWGGKVKESFAGVGD